MKLNIMELRDMVKAAVRQTVTEARKPKDVPQRSEESIHAQRASQVAALPGYTHGKVLDMSKPLGKRNRLKRQGAANMGNWTSESRLAEGPGNSLEDLKNTFSRKLFTLRKANPQISYELDELMRVFSKALAAAGEKTVGYSGPVNPTEHGLDNPDELGIEAQHEGLARLIDVIVAEEIRLVRGSR